MTTAPCVPHLGSWRANCFWISKKRGPVLSCFTHKQTRKYDQNKFKGLLGGLSYVGVAVTMGWKKNHEFGLTFDNPREPSGCCWVVSGDKGLTY